ncbi:MAG: cytochrome b/b6 domain-containing protein [Pseudomonadota bacterium]
MSRILVWDLPTRLFHWLLVAAFIAAYLLGEEDGLLGWHSYFGYLLGGLILFRLVWGFVGGHYSRFADFPPAPGAAWRYVKDLFAGKERHSLGHNPAGALAIYALLGLGLATVVSGLVLFAADKGLGPLAGIAPAHWEDAAEEVHEFAANAMLLVVLVHLAGVAVGSLKHRENLPRAMVTGYKTVQPGQGAAVPVSKASLVALMMLAGVVLLATQHDFSVGDDKVRVVREAGDGQEDEGDHDDEVHEGLQGKDKDEEHGD